MKRLFDWTARWAAATCLWLAAAVLPAGAATAHTADEAAGEPFAAQVVAVQWLNPLQRWDYPTEWQLLWTLGLARPNPDDEMLKASPGQFGSLQYVRPVAGAADDGESFAARHERTLGALLQGLGSRYVSDPQAFYSVAHPDRRRWRELGRIRVEYALPEERLDAGEAAEAVRLRIVEAFTAKLAKESAKLPSSGAPAPDVQVTMNGISAGANAGFMSLIRAFDYLRAHPRDCVWVMSWDAPGLPAEESIDQNMVLLLLAGPEASTGRRALALIGAPVAPTFYPHRSRGTEEESIERWQKTIRGAARNVGRDAADITFLLHDAGSRLPGDYRWDAFNAEKRLRSLAQGLRPLLPGLDYARHVLDTPTLLGHMGAGTALTNVALGIAYAHHAGKPVLVAATTHPKLPAAVVIAPPAGAQPADAARKGPPWFRAQDEKSARLPWWGVRLDAPAYPAGYSE